MSLMWESVDLPGAFRTFQPGGRQHSIRDMRMTSMQMGATSLIYQSAIGQPRVADLGGEEALYILETVDGQLFHYSPFVGGRGMVICVGPIRSGKTFFKNCLASHTLKYGGLYRAMDIDPGTETVAKALGDKAGIFRVDKTPGSGFNPFASYRGEGDHQFVAHITDLALEMMRANDDPRLQTLDKNEQSHLDAAVRKVLRLPQQMQNLRTLVAHMPSALKQKFIRWIRASEVGGHGRYAFLLDEDKDSIGALDTPFAVFNLQGIKADLKAMRPIQLELLYRITQAFEDPALRGVPKTLDIDEAHFPLGIPAFSEYIVEKIRTWGKFMGSVQLWTQSPEELGKVSGWSALRSAASTFIFMADPKMDEQLYIDTFKISLGECEAIRNLIPRREAYIIQPELGVSKKVILNTEPEQYALNTSHPREAALRDRLIETHGFQEGIKRFLEAKDRLENPAIQQDAEPSTRQLHVA